MADGYRIYESERGTPLLYIHQPSIVPVLTLENYTKWYEGMYLVMPDGEVRKVPVTVVDEVNYKHRDAQWIDHCYHPRMLYRVAQHLGAVVDERSVEVAIGRWMLESGSCDKQASELNFLDPNL